MLVQLIAAVAVCTVSALFEDGSVSGDFLEHWNKDPLAAPSGVGLDVIQGLHVSLFSENKVRVTWMTPTPFAPGSSSLIPMCMYGQMSSQLPHATSGFSYTYTAGYFNHTLSSVLVDLSVLPTVYTQLFYKCGYQNLGWSQVYPLKLQPPTVVNENLDGAGIGDLKNLQAGISDDHSADVAPNPAKTLALIGDLGVIDGSDTMAALDEFVDIGLVHAIVHAGDISYADNFSKDKHNNSYIWVEYMNEISTFTPKLPYMTCPGNHEAQYDFAAYMNWLPMPYSHGPSRSPFWGSFDYMGVHFLSMSTEHDFSQSSAQYQFLKQDLTRANQNRRNVPWIIVFGHRPLYCTCTVSESRCTVDAPRFRSYVEDLFKEQAVDVYVCGHNHNYERTYPMYKEKALQKDFVNPRAPVYIVNGEAGNPEPNNPSFVPGVDWRANFSGSADNGFLVLTPTANSLRFQYVQSQTRTVVDTFTITKS